MSNKKLTDIQEKGMRIRAAVLMKVRNRGTISQFDLDLLELLESRDMLEEQVATLEKVVNMDAEFDAKFDIRVSPNNPDHFIHTPKDEK